MATRGCASTCDDDEGVTCHSSVSIETRVAVCAMWVSCFVYLRNVLLHCILLCWTV